MEIDKEKQARAIERAKTIIAEAEKRRASVRAVKGVGDFATGNFEVFLNEENVHNLAKHIVKLYNDKGYQAIAPYVDKLREGIDNSDQEIRERVVMTISIVTNNLLFNDDVKIIVLFHEMLVTWLKKEETFINGFGIICKQLQESTKLLLTKKLWSEVDSLLVVLYQIQNGILEKNSSIQGMIVKLQENLATKEILEDLTNTYLDDYNSQKEAAESLLTYLGRRPVIFLLNRLMHAADKKERIRLIKLIPYAGNTAVPILVDCLQKEPPWFVIRNIIFIISEIGDTSLFSIVRPFMNHPDIRVQQQVVSCIAKFGGSKMQSRLLEVLPVISDEIKVQLVMELGQMEGSEVADAMVDLLEKRFNFQDRVASNLIEKICISLKFFPNAKSVDALNDLIEERQRLNIPDDRVLTTAIESLAVIEPKIRRSKKLAAGQNDYVSFDDDSIDPVSRSRNIQELEAKAAKYIESDDLDEACNLIFNHIRITAREKDFSTAEYLRDKLLEINPMALSEVIKAGEIIEEEKSSSITSHHLNIWGELYDYMTTEEFNALYYAMKAEVYVSDEIIVKEGETDESLYFINSGHVSLICNCGNNQIFLKRLQPGDIIGVGEFFSVSVWTVTMIAQTECQINVLERDAFKNIAENHAGLDSKLQDFCIKHDNIHDLIKMSGSDRREFPRYEVSVIINSMLLDPYGNPGKRSFKGEMLDISKGGLCFSIHISSKDNARLLLGRQIVCDVKVGRTESIKCAGIIVGIKYTDHVENDFSIHVRLHKNLKQVDVMKVVNLIM